MKKLLNLNWFERPSQKLNLKMRLTALFFLSALLSLQANEAIAENSSVALNHENVTVLAVENEGNVSLQTQITGTVTDATGEPLPGATILEKGTNNGVTSDFDGNFSITVSNPDATLVVSFIGYTSIDVPLNGSTQVNVTLEESASTLDEVVLVGYGTVKKSDLTGAVTSISSEEIKKAPMTSIDQGIQGRASGVQVTSGSGAPGGAVSIRIRGGNSINSGNEPLYVIDGFPIYSDNNEAAVPGTGNGNITSQNALSSINPNDIQSIEVLKDASATAIYGSRGANGVVLITTKRGSSGKSKIEYNTYYAVQELRRKVPVLNARQYTEAWNEGLINDGKDPMWGYNGLKSPAEWEAAIGEGTDWQDEVYQSAPMMNHQLSVSGGNDKTKYLISGNYFDQDGIIANTQFQRFSVRSNIDTQYSDRLRTGISMAFSHTVSDLGQTELSNAFGGAGIVAAALMNSPLIPVYDEDGVFTDRFDNDKLGRYTMNPVAEAELTKDRSLGNRFLGNAFVDYTILKGLSLKVSIGGDLQNSKRNIYLPRGTLQGNARDGRASHGYRTITSWLNENILTYAHDFNDNHRLNIVAGYTIQSSQSSSDLSSADGFINDNLQDNEISAGANFGIPNSSQSKWSLASYLGRINYNLYDKYLFTVSARADGSSKFGADNKWAFFPSIAGAWKVKQEDFMKDVDNISELKLRASYGVTGNSQIPQYQSLSRLSVQSYNFNGVRATGFGPSNIANPELKWETTKMTNFGIDLGMFKNRLTLTAEYYSNITEDLLLNATVPYSTGFSSAFRNVGSMSNKGVEISLGGDIFVGDFKWKSTVNWSRNRNKITDIGDSDPFFTAAIASSVGGTYVRVGYPVGIFWGPKVIGIFETQEQLDNEPLRGGDRQTLGDKRYLDVNGDGIIDGDDNTVMGNPNPDFIYSWNNNFSYKNFDLTVFINGVEGADIINATFRRLESGVANGANQTQRTFDDAWRADGSGGNRIRLSDNGTYGQSGDSNLVRDGSFLRVKNIVLGYNIPIKSGLTGLSAAKVYVSGQNLFTFTDYVGYDPEVNAYGQSNLVMGADVGSYPTTKSFLLGVNLSF